MSVILLSGLLSYFGFVSTRYRGRLITGIARSWLRMRGQTSMNSLGERVLIVGAGEVARFAIWLLSNENMAQAFSIVGMVDDNPRKVDTKLDGYPILNTTSSIPDLVKKYDVGLILFAIADIDPTEQDRILSLCQTTPARITPIPDIIDSLRAHFPKNEMEREVHFNKVLYNATIDRLTGAYNRQHFISLGELELNRSQRYGHPLSLLALHLDYVRPQKTGYAKTVEKQVLQSAAGYCLRSIRGIDLLGRFDDDKLVILLPETNEEAAHLVANRIRRYIANNPVDTNRGPVQTLVDVHLVTSTQEDFTDLETMLKRLLEPFSTVGKSTEAIAFINSSVK